MKLAANAAIFFKELPIEQRIEKIAELGFEAADLFGLKGFDIPSLAKTCRACGVTITMVVAGELQRGLNDPELHGEMEEKVREAAGSLRELGGANVVVLSGNTRPRVARSAQDRAVIDGLKRLAPIADEFGVSIVLEMLNSRYDHVGYYLDDTEQMANLVRAVGHPRVRTLYDIYHAGIMRGNIIEDLRGQIDVLGHVHIAGIPGRHEPKDGEQNCPVILRALDAAGYEGHIAFEYNPLKDPAESLQETRAWLLGE